ncbi:MAG: murein hydrolase activator EnvC family protein [Acidimicrobiales bacterium]
MPTTFTRTLIVTLVSASVAVGPSVAADETLSDLRRQRDQAREDATAAIAELELLAVEDEEVAHAVAEMQAAVDSQLARVDGARQALAAAQTEVAARVEAVGAVDREIDRLEDEIAARAVEAFIGVAADGEIWLAASDLNRTAVRLALLDVASGIDRDGLDELRRSRAERDEHLEAGRRARADAAVRRTELEALLVELDRRLDLQLDVQAELDRRIAEWEATADALARAAEDMTALIRRTQVEELGFELGDPGAASVQGFVMPVKGAVGSGFGRRRHPILGAVRMHTGVDIGGDTGDSVWASKAGVVLFAGRRGGYGNTIVVQHEGGVTTLYAHLSEIHVSAGDSVDRGEGIGLVGSTGLSTGPHLHFEVRRDGSPEDPLLFLPA